MKRVGGRQAQIGIHAFFEWKLYRFSKPARPLPARRAFLFPHFGQAAIVCLGARAKGGEKFIQLPELFGHRPFHARTGFVARFPGRIEFAQDQQRLAAFRRLEGDRGHGAVFAFVIGPDEARGRRHFEIFAEEGHRAIGIMSERDAVAASGADIHLAGKKRDAAGFRRPPLLEQFGLGPRVEYEADRAVETARHHEFALGPPLDRGMAVTHIRTHRFFLPFQSIDGFFQHVEARLLDLLA